MSTWRLQLKPAPKQGITYEEVRDFCIKEGIIGVGWSAVDCMSTDINELRKSITLAYPTGMTSAFKAINAIGSMRINDLVWTRLNGIYHLCRVCNQLLEGQGATDAHKDFDIIHYVPVEWVEVGTEDKVPGKVINSFSYPATVQHVNNVEMISKLIWNKKSNPESYKYEARPLTMNDFWESINSEDLESLILLYLQKQKGYCIYTSTLKVSTGIFECVMIKNDGSHLCYPQVKRNNVLNASYYEKILKNGNDMIYLFSTIQQDNFCSNPQINYIERNEIEKFMHENGSLLQDTIKAWFDFVKF